MKEYFSHDYHARSDRKLVNLRMKMGWEGVGLYWCIIEMLYENNGAINLSEIERIAFELGTQSERITELLKGFELFKFRGGVFYSESVNERLEKRSEKSDKARLSAVTRWDRERNKDTNAMRTHTDRNAIKVNKSKVKEKDKNILFDEFWIAYHKTSGLSKTDKEAAIKHWNKLSDAEMDKAINMIPVFIQNCKAGYIKKARTYLADKNFNDEYQTTNRLAL